MSIGNTIISFLIDENLLWRDVTHTVKNRIDGNIDFYVSRQIFLYQGLKKYFK